MPRDSPRGRSLRIKSASSAVVLILAILPLVGATTASAQTATPSPPDGVQPGSYTFEEAVALGIDTGPDPDESGLPLCDLDPDWGGLAPDESVPEEAIDDPSTCVADPKYATFTVGATPPHAGYHWNGYNIVNATVAGALAEIEIRVGQVDHLAHTSEQEEFIVSRVITSNTAKRYDASRRPGWRG